MIDKVAEEKKKRYEKLHELIADPKVIANTSEYQGYAKELAGLTPLIKEYNEYVKLLKDLKDLDQGPSGKA